ANRTRGRDVPRAAPRTRAEARSPRRSRDTRTRTGAWPNVLRILLDPARGHDPITPRAGSTEEHSPAAHIGQSPAPAHRIPCPPVNHACTVDPPSRMLLADGAVGRASPRLQRCP